MLQIDRLSYRIGNRLLLDGLSLNVGKGQYYALAGENGVGKSTLIRILLDLIRDIDDGRIEIAGRDRRDPASRRVLAYLPEKFDLPAEVTGWQYLRFVSGVYRESLSHQRVLALCRQLALDETRLADRSRRFSKGMKQKLGLISCFMLRVPLIILDEPLSGLDPRARYCFKQLLNREREQGRTLFYSTHMLADAEEICDRFGILHGGRILFEGSPAECRARYHSDTLEQAYMRATGALQGC
jgi:ABC-2 type transport system ATP-binding protein